MSASKRPGRWMLRHSTYSPIKQTRDIAQEKKEAEKKKKQLEKRLKHKIKRKLEKKSAASLIFTLEKNKDGSIENQEM